MIYHVQNFGAKADGVTNDAPAIQAAIDTCSAAGGGRVVLESGKTYYARTVLVLDILGTLLQKYCVE